MSCQAGFYPRWYPSSSFSSLPAHENTKPGLNLLLLLGDIFLQRNDGIIDRVNNSGIASLLIHQERQHLRGQLGLRSHTKRMSEMGRAANSWAASDCVMRLVFDE
jgi:hypothetical protein